MKNDQWVAKKQKPQGDVGICSVCPFHWLKGSVFSVIDGMNSKKSAYTEVIIFSLFVFTKQIIIIYGTFKSKSTPRGY